MQNEKDRFRKTREEYQAREILTVLAHNVFNGRAHDGVLADILHQVALGGAGPQIRNVLNQMEQLGLVRTQEIDKHVVVELTEQGERVANGDDKCAGVALFQRS